MFQFVWIFNYSVKSPILNSYNLSWWWVHFIFCSDWKYEYLCLGETVYVCMLSHLVMSNSLLPHGLQPTRFLCPWDSSGKNTGVGCCTLLQGIFPSQDWTCISYVYLHWQGDASPLAPPGKPVLNCVLYKLLAIRHQTSYSLWVIIS